MGAVLAAIAALAPLIEKYGIPFVASLVGMLSKSTPPTQADWDALAKLTATTARQQMLDTLAAHNIDPASPAGIAFLALTPA